MTPMNNLNTQEKQMIFQSDDLHNRQRARIEDAKMQEFNYFDKINKTTAEVTYPF